MHVKDPPTREEVVQEFQLPKYHKNPGIDDAPDESSTRRGLEAELPH